MTDTLPVVWMKPLTMQRSVVAATSASPPTGRPFVTALAWRGQKQLRTAGGCGSIILDALQAHFFVPNRSVNLTNHCPGEPVRRYRPEYYLFITRAPRSPAPTHGRSMTPCQIKGIDQGHQRCRIAILTAQNPNVTPLCQSDYDPLRIHTM
jgi:hypothetical protein